MHKNGILFSELSVLLAVVRYWEILKITLLFRTHYKTCLQRLNIHNTTPVLYSSRHTSFPLLSVWQWITQGQCGQALINGVPTAGPCDPSLQFEEIMRVYKRHQKGFCLCISLSVSLAVQPVIHHLSLRYWKWNILFKTPNVLPWAVHLWVRPLMGTTLGDVRSGSTVGILDSQNSTGGQKTPEGGSKDYHTEK